MIAHSVTVHFPFGQQKKELSSLNVSVPADFYYIHDRMNCVRFYSISEEGHRLTGLPVNSTVRGELYRFWLRVDRPPRNAGTTMRGLLHFFLGLLLLA